MSQECSCSRISETRQGVCLIHKLAPITNEVLEEIQKRSQSVIRRYVVNSLPTPQAVEVVSEEITERSYGKIQQLKDSLDVKTMDDLVNVLVKEYGFRGNPDKMIEGPVPLIITGPPLSGKTKLAKRLVEKFEKVFVLDVKNEYSDLKLLPHQGELYGDIWRRETRFRWIPDSNPFISKYTLPPLFGTLTQTMRNPDSGMKDFCFVFEDAIRLAELIEFQSFLSESRAFIRKSIVITQRLAAFEGMGQTVKP